MALLNQTNPTPRTARDAASRTSPPDVPRIAEPATYRIRSKLAAPLKSARFAVGLRYEQYAYRPRRNAQQAVV